MSALGPPLVSSSRRFPTSGESDAAGLPAATAHVPRCCIAAAGVALHHLLQHAQRLTAAQRTCTWRAPYIASDTHAL
jgi:hypothetical protein